MQEPSSGLSIVTGGSNVDVGSRVTVGIRVPVGDGAGLVLLGGVGELGELQEKSESMAKIVRHVMTRITADAVLEVMPKFPAMNLRNLLQLPLNGPIFLPQYLHFLPCSEDSTQNSTNRHVINIRPRIPPFGSTDIRDGSVDIVERYLYCLSCIRTQVELRGFPARVPDFTVATRFIPFCVAKLTNCLTVDVHLEKVLVVQVITENPVPQRKCRADSPWHLQRLLDPRFSHRYAALTLIVRVAKDGVALVPFTLNILTEFAPMLPTFKASLLKVAIAERHWLRRRCNSTKCCLDKGIHCNNKRYNGDYTGHPLPQRVTKKLNEQVTSVRVFSGDLESGCSITILWIQAYDLF